MEYLQLGVILVIIYCSAVEIKSLPIESQHQVAASITDNIQLDLLPSTTGKPDNSIISAIPLTLHNLEDVDKTSSDGPNEHQRSTRGLDLLGLGGLGGFGNKFGGLGLGYKGLGGLGSWNLGGLHGLGFGGYKPFFGKYFG